VKILQKVLGGGATFLTHTVNLVDPSVYDLNYYWCFVVQHVSYYNKMLFLCAVKTLVFSNWEVVHSVVVNCVFSAFLVPYFMLPFYCGYRGHCSFCTFQYNSIQFFTQLLLWIGLTCVAMLLFVFCLPCCDSFDSR